MSRAIAPRRRLPSPVRSVPAALSRLLLFGDSGIDFFDVFVGEFPTHTINAGCFS